MTALPGILSGGAVDLKMRRYILRRLGLAAITLVILSVIVFLIASVLPGSVGRAILGPFADPHSVALLNKELGLDGPLYSRYLSWAGHAVTLDFGESYQYRGSAVTDLLWTALWNSAKLAVLIVAIVVPLAVVGGAVAALRQGKTADRIITVAGLTLAVTPEIVTGVVLITLLAVNIDLFPASWPVGEIGLLDQLRAMILPALTLVAVLFGYIARMARVGTIEALAADYTRTATLKGLPWNVVLRRHVLRNALLPTITVIATQAGYLLGGLLVTETLFNYPGIGRLVFTAAKGRDIPMMMAGVIVVGAIYMLLTLSADVLTAWLNPRIRLGSVNE